MEQDLTSVEVVGLAIRSEEDAAKFYGEMSKRVGNELVRARFESLAREEIAHRTMLVDLYKKMTGDTSSPAKIPGQPETAEGGGVPTDVEDFEKLLLIAVEREQEASKFYKEGAAKAKDPTGRRILEYLSEVEMGHEALLQSELKMYRRNADWYLNEPPDLQHIGP